MTGADDRALAGGARAVRAVGVAIALAAVGCGGGRSLNPRSFARDGVSEVPLRSIAVAAFQGSPAAIVDGSLENLEAFPPPGRNEALGSHRVLDRRGTMALGDAVVDALRARGFEARRLDADGDATVESLRASCCADADGLLIVRAIPLDPLTALAEEAEIQVISPSGAPSGEGALPIGQVQSVDVPGRALLGQMFLYHAETGVRLWSEHLPGVPADRKLRVDSDLLEFGAAGAEAARLSGLELERAAAAGFARAALASHPAPRASGSLAQLEGIDVAAEERRERFFDRRHFALDVGAGWSFEEVGQSVGVPGSDPPELPDLTTGALSPAGALGAELRGSFITAGGLSFDAYLTYGRFLDDGFTRRVFADAGDPSFALGTQRVASEERIGGGLGLGRIFMVGDGLFLHPAALGFIEQWRFEVSPGTSFDRGDHVRGGLEGRLDLRWLPSSGPWMLRLGASARGGLDAAGPAFLGVGASVGVGILR